MSAPKILVFDIETAPIVASVWGIWEQNIGLNMIEQDWTVLAWSAKWLGDKPNKIMYMDQRNQKNVRDDRKILQGIWDLLDECDIVVTQNGKAFDVKKLNARFILSGMKPPSSYRHIDTKQIAKKHFGFTSNKLEYMTDKLCTKYKKLVNRGIFSGFELWKECLKGNKKAWNEMEKYSKYDVLSLEELFMKLRAWDNSVTLGTYADSTKPTCACGNSTLIAKGYSYTNTGKFKRFICGGCGTQMQSRLNEHGKGKISTILK